ncbi:uncharacterized protein LOC135291648 isoform X2 [Passer domesticus]|uniref:uncharacterized protein LOC135291648 isoform X2 n=1 Tax=Passer domesticus TaxID=48849 RepID=UPI0030FEEE90
MEPLEELQRRVGDIKASLKGTNEVSPNVPEDYLVAKVAEAKRLWEANTRLAEDHLLGTVDNIIDFLFDGGLTSPSACEVAERCRRAIEDIPRLLRPPKHPRSVPKVSPVSMELQKLWPAPPAALEALFRPWVCSGERLGFRLEGRGSAVKRLLPNRREETDSSCSTVHIYSRGTNSRTP